MDPVHCCRDEPPIAAATVTGNYTLQSRVTGTVAHSVSVTDSTLVFVPIKSFTSLDTLSLTLTSALQDTNGLPFDGNGNGDPDGSPADDYRMQFYTVALGDYNLDGAISLWDLTAFRDAWLAKPQVLEYELAPVGGASPHLRVLPDGKINFDDLVVFANTWNWYTQGASQSIAVALLAKAKASEVPIRLEPVYQGDKYWSDMQDNEFAIELWMEEDYIPNGLGITMVIDPKIMKYSRFEANQAFEAKKGGWFVLDWYDAETGVLVINMADFSSASKKTTFNGCVGKIFADVLQVTETSLPFHYELTLTGENAAELEGESVTVISTSPPLPTEFALYQNYPNPFNPTTTIRFELPEAVDVHLVVYDILGREIVRLKNEQMEAGYHQVRWNGRDGIGRYIASGIYFARMATPRYSKTVKMLLLK